MRKKGALLLIVCSFVLTLVLPGGSGGLGVTKVTDVSSNFSTQSLIHGLGG